jgi:hypothetical protein
LHVGAYILGCCAEGFSVADIRVACFDPPYLFSVEVICTIFDSLIKELNYFVYTQ